MKFIIFEFNGIPTPVIFPEHVTHLDLASGKFLREATQESAGFVDIDAMRVRVHGGSNSLLLSAKAEDQSVICQALDRPSLAPEHVVPMEAVAN